MWILILVLIACLNKTSMSGSIWCVFFLSSGKYKISCILQSLSRRLLEKWFFISEKNQFSRSNKLLLWSVESLSKKCPSSDFFGPHFSHFFPHSDWILIDTEYLSVFCPNAVKCGKNGDQNKSEHGHFLLSEFFAFFPDFFWDTFWFPTLQISFSCPLVIKHGRAKVSLDNIRNEFKK